MQVNIKDGAIKVGISDDISGTVENALSSSLSLSVFHHVVLNFNKAGSGELWVDNVKIHTFTQVFTGNFTSQYTSIGVASYGDGGLSNLGDQVFALDLMRVYSGRNLSAAEIGALYDEGSA